MHQQDEKVEFYNQPQAEFNKVKKRHHIGYGRS